MLLELTDDNSKLKIKPEQTQAQKDNTKKLLENLLLAETEINDCQNRFRGMLTLQGEQPHQSAKIKLELLQ